MVVKWECPICRDEHFTEIHSCILDTKVKRELTCDNCKSKSELTIKVSYKEDNYEN
jgi:hypothetical protein